MCRVAQTERLGAVGTRSVSKNFAHGIKPLFPMFLGLLLKSNGGRDSKSRDTLLVPAAPRPVVWATRKITTKTFSTAQPETIAFGSRVRRLVLALGLFG